MQAPIVTSVGPQAPASLLKLLANCHALCLRLLPSTSTLPLARRLVSFSPTTASLSAAQNVSLHSLVPQGASPDTLTPVLLLTAPPISQKDPEDFEQALAVLSRDIQKRQTRLNEIRLRERRSTLLFSVYALLLWIAYTALWYTGLLPNLTRYRGSVRRTIEGVPVFVGPIVYVSCCTCLCPRVSSRADDGFPIGSCL